ncbi:MAG TPA: hypothetical protein VHV78_05205 [Gemmatimonadaceae bacterium]|jgi:hypothetical protein|nr:hypothetical protein [Gemmatimonadaceae bacterium]
MTLTARRLAAAAVLVTAACGRGTAGTAPQPGVSSATISQIYAWRAKPGKFDEYTRYIRDVAAPIDHEAQRTGAFLSVTTYAVNDTTVPWTHLRVFLLRDSAQLRGLSDALTAAGIRLQPDSVKRRLQGEYSASLRDRVSSSVAQIVR